MWIADKYLIIASIAFHMVLKQYYEYQEFYLVVLGGSLLSLTAGFLNAVTLVGYYGVFVTHITGILIKVSINLFALDWIKIMENFALILSFFMGSLLSGLTIGHSKFRIGRKYAAVLIIEAASLGLASLMLINDINSSIYIVSFACGLQNAIATTYSSAIIRTAAVIGIYTDIGVVFGHYLRKRFGKEEADPSCGENATGNLYVLVPLLFSHWFGGFLGVLSWHAIGVYSMILPAMSIASAALYYLTSEPIRAAAAYFKDLDEKALEMQKIDMLRSKYDEAIRKESTNMTILQSSNLRYQELCLEQQEIEDYLRIKWTRTIAGITIEEDSPKENNSASPTVTNLGGLHQIPASKPFVDMI